jgi:hypothetical protein
LTGARLACVLVAIVPTVVSAQTLTVGVYGLMGTYNEVAAANRASGFGGALGADVTVTNKIAIEALGSYASTTPADDPTLPAYTVLEGQLHVRYALASVVAVELGYVRRRIDPEFAAQDIGGFSVGARVAQRLADAADIYVRGAFIPISQFSGGGSAALSYQVGFGVSIGPSSARWKVTAEYDFLRFGRTVSDADVPIQSETARIGIALVVF